MLERLEDRRGSTLVDKTQAVGRKQAPEVIRVGRKSNIRCNDRHVGSLPGQQRQPGTYESAGRCSRYITLIPSSSFPKPDEDDDDGGVRLPQRTEHP